MDGNNKDNDKDKASERRSVLRIDSLNFVSFSYLDGETKTITEDLGRTLDISLGGIKLEVPSSRVPNAEIELHIALEEVVIDVRGEIAHVENYDNGCSDVGIRFIEISRGDKMALENFLRDIRISQ